MAHREPVREHTTCRNCGATFDLSIQPYYDSLCPDCIKKHGDEKRTWQRCFRCGEKIPPDQLTTEKVREPHGGSSHLPVHEDCWKPPQPRGPP